MNIARNSALRYAIVIALVLLLCGGLLFLGGAPPLLVPAFVLLCLVFATDELFPAFALTLLRHPAIDRKSPRAPPLFS